MATERAEQPVVRHLTLAMKAPAAVKSVLNVGQIDRLLAAVEEQRAARTAVEDQEAALVGELRAAGLSWDSCGWFLEVTGSAVRQRWAERLGGS